jgi:hypothetical protein
MLEVGAAWACLGIQLWPPSAARAAYREQALLPRLLQRAMACGGGVARLGAWHKIV